MLIIMGELHRYCSCLHLNPRVLVSKYCIKFLKAMLVVTGGVVLF